MDGVHRDIPIVQIDGLTRRFGQLLAVDAVRLEIREGEVFGLLGPNGAGKTTTISMLTTLLQPTEGSARVNGFDVVGEANRVRASIGLVFQETVLDEDLTARDNLDFHARLYGLSKEEKERRIRELLELVELQNRQRARVETFSGGMKRKLEIARGLLHHPRVLFLDEPTLGLDPKARRAIWEHLARIRDEKNITMVLTTHYMDEADHLCDRVAIMNKGKIVTVDTPANLKNSLGGDVIILKTDEYRDDFLRALRALEFVKDVKNEQEGVLVVVEHGETKIESLITLTRSRGLPVHSIALHKPTLEDVFLYYTGEQLEG